jgi:hypothetical protein
MLTPPDLLTGKLFQLAPVEIIPFACQNKQAILRH